MEIINYPGGNCHLRELSVTGMIFCDSYPMGELSGWELSELEMPRQELFQLAVDRGRSCPGGSCQSWRCPVTNYSGWKLTGVGLISYGGMSQDGKRPSVLVRVAFVRVPYICQPFIRLPKFSLGRPNIGQDDCLPILVDSSDCFMCQKYLKVISVLVAIILACQLPCDNFPGKFI